MIGKVLSCEENSRIKSAMTDVVEALGLDLNDDSLVETPHRIAKMHVDELVVDNVSRR